MGSGCPATGDLVAAERGKVDGGVTQHHACRSGKAMSCSPAELPFPPFPALSLTKSPPPPPSLGCPLHRGGKARRGCAAAAAATPGTCSKRWQSRQARNRPPALSPARLRLPQARVAVRWERRKLCTMAASPQRQGPALTRCEECAVREWIRGGGDNNSSWVLGHVLTDCFVTRDLVVAGLNTSPFTSWEGFF